MNKKGILFTVLGVILVIILAFLLLKDTNLIKGSQLEAYKGEFTFFEEEADAQDESINPDRFEDGKSIYNGGPYKVGDLVYKDGIGVKIETVGWKNNAIEIEESDDIDYAIFELSIYNYNNSTYDIKTEDVVVEYEGLDGTIHSQPISLSGYDRWKFIDGSFQFEEIGKNTLRKGYLFTPIEGKGKEEGVVIVHINKVPIKFTY